MIGQLILCPPYQRDSKAHNLKVHSKNFDDCVNLVSKPHVSNNNITMPLSLDCVGKMISFTPSTYIFIDN